MSLPHIITLRSSFISWGVILHRLFHSPLAHLSQQTEKLHPDSRTEASLQQGNWPNSQIPECTCSISHNAPFRTEKCTFLFWMEHCGIWDRCILGFVKLVYCRGLCQGQPVAFEKGVNLHLSGETIMYCDLLRIHYRWGIPDLYLD